MKTEIKALPLSLALSFLALLGACSSVNSTPNSELPSGDNSVILEGTESEPETVEDLTSDSLDGEATSETLETESAEMETPEGLEEDSAFDTEMTETESAEMETPEGLEEDSAIDTEMTETESAEEVNPTEIILPESDSAEVETDSEAAENLTPELETEMQPE